MMHTDGRRMSLEVEETMFVQTSRWSWRDTINNDITPDVPHYNDGYLQEDVYPYLPTSAQDDGYLQDIGAAHCGGAVFTSGATGDLSTGTSYDITHSGQLPVQSRSKPNRKNTPNRYSQYISTPDARIKPFNKFVGPPYL